MYYRTKSDSVTDKNLPRNKSFAFICSMPLGFLNNTVTVTESGMSFYLAANKYAAHFQCISLSPASMCDARNCKRRTGEGEEPIQRQKLEQFIDQQRQFPLNKSAHSRQLAQSSDLASVRCHAQSKVAFCESPTTSSEGQSVGPLGQDPVLTKKKKNSKDQLTRGWNCLQTVSYTHLRAHET